MNAALLALVLATRLPAADAVIVFEDRFEGRLAQGWTWLREDPKTWRLKDGALEIRVEPGRAPDVKNALLYPAPDRMKRPYAIEVTVTFTTPPTNQYEQGGITWYHDGKPAFKLVHELVDGRTYIIPGRIATAASTVQLRLIVSSEGYDAHYRPDAKGPFVFVTDGKLPPPGNDQVSIQCYNGPSDAEHWIRFDNFRIVEVR